MANILNALDRSIVGFLAEPIKHDLALSDSALGFPIARRADHGARRPILTLSIALWSTMLLLCGAARSYLQLLTARAGLAIGESACLPVSLSLISDLFPADRRMRATSLFQAAAMFGVMAGLPILGWVAASFGWRAAMFVLGLPGLLLAAAVHLTMPEPARGVFDPPQPGLPPALPLGAALHQLSANRPFVLLAIGLAVNSVSAGAQAAFVPAYMQRAHGMSPLEIGLSLGPLVGGAGMLGIVVGGFVAESVRRKRGDAAVVAIFAMAEALGCVGTGLFFAARDVGMMLAAGAAQAFLAMLKTGPFISLTVSLVAPRMRALAATIVGVIAISLIGTALGPMFVGILSDALQPAAGGLALRDALILVCCGGIALSLAFFVSVVPSLSAIDRQGRTDPDHHLYRKEPGWTPS
jgi:predicted MFS family arabinose efflux permease